ncbi:MraY family glycosyltransferase [Segetibacter koreensis]|uniref:MraY family glycosyltransferase n=1 Tax=Segetibacter koreensis TaxID=398037 RepID=UPI00036342C4|nr:MraY family glycosyltransferase [Segetibacter koreensis]
MEQILFVSILAFLTTLFAIPRIIYVSEKKNLFDNPDSVRKLHKQPISSLGGLGIFLGFIISILLMGNFFQLYEFQYYVACFILIFFVGIKDDLVEISAIKKFIGQALVACVLMFKAHLLITNMAGFLGITHIYFSFSVFLTFFTIIVIINAFNLIDGVDGLAGSLGLISSLVFGTFFLVNGNIPYALLGFGFAGSLVAFLIYNFQPAKIFMGDTGSLLMGVVNSILVIKFIQSGTNYHLFSVTAVPAIGFSVLLLPLMDTLRVFGIRIFHGLSPFTADRNHIHHLLLDRGFTHRNITFTCSAISILFIVAAFLLQSAGTTWLIAGLISCFFVIIFSIKRLPVKVPMRVVKNENKINLKSEEEQLPSRRTN